MVDQVQRLEAIIRAIEGQRNRALVDCSVQIAENELLRNEIAALKGEVARLIPIKNVPVAGAPETQDAGDAVLHG